MASPTKELETQKFSFHCKTERFSTSFQGLNSSLAQSTGKLRSCIKWRKKSPNAGNSNYEYLVHRQWIRCRENPHSTKGVKPAS